jgi:NAD(P)-dependent dehydrogenase (short-subunit alcohol dehydrogenase family)
MANALVWGASGGIGQALVRLFKSEGWQVYGAGRTTAQIPDSADLAVHFDADYEHSFEAVVMRVAQETTELDVMVYAVGELAYDKLEGIGLDGWNRTLRSNLTGAYLATVHGMSLMKEGAHHVYIGAYIDHLRLPKMGAYVAAKAGLQELVTVLQKEHRKHKFTLVRPGAVDTPFWEQVSLKLPANAKQAEDVARAILARVASGEAGDLDL